ncbi:MAG: hypothetical protein J0H31_08680 [Alphaproteobacteria bacterium]|nr:hypothetical protein [Alphaproteobacteria bacterium]
MTFFAECVNADGMRLTSRFDFDFRPTEAGKSKASDGEFARRVGDTYLRGAA